MKLLLQVEINEERLNKIAWDLGMYPDDLPDDVECKDWLESWMRETFDNMPERPK